MADHSFSLRHWSDAILVACVLLCPSLVFAQAEVRSSSKGATTPLAITGTSIDADHNALDVAIKEGSITLNGADGAILDGASAAIKATVKDYTNSNPLTVIGVDTNGDVTSFGGGTQYTEDAAAAADPVGTATICVRRDTLTAAEVSADGDNVACKADSAGRIHVNPGILGVEDAAETAGGNLGMVGTVRRDTAASSAGTTGDNATLNTDATGRLWVRPTGAVTPADNTANPTDAITVFSLNGCYDGATWDLCVKGTAGSGTVDANTTRTAEATDSQLSADIAAIKTAVQLIDDDQTGSSIKHFVTAGSTEDETEVKATAGRLLSVQASNSAATVAYLRCANLTAANTTPGTSTVFWGMAVPGATTGAGVVANFGPTGIAFSTALTCWVVGGKAETDVAEVGANDVQVNIQYK